MTHSEQQRYQDCVTPHLILLTLTLLFAQVFHKSCTHLAKNNPIFDFKNMSNSIIKSARAISVVINVQKCTKYRVLNGQHSLESAFWSPNFVHRFDNSAKWIGLPPT